MAQGWHGNSEGHAKAGRIGGRKSAESRRARATTEFGEQISSPHLTEPGTKKVKTTASPDSPSSESAPQTK